MKYAEIAVKAKPLNWSAKLFPVEVGCRRFVVKSTTRFLKRMRVKGQTFRQTVKALSEAEEQSSKWLWIKKTDAN